MRRVMTSTQRLVILWSIVVNVAIAMMNVCFITAPASRIYTIVSLNPDRTRYSIGAFPANTVSLRVSARPRTESTPSTIQLTRFNLVQSPTFITSPLYTTMLTM